MTSVENRAIPADIPVFPEIGSVALNLMRRATRNRHDPLNQIPLLERSNGYDPNLLNKSCVAMKYILCELSWESFSVRRTGSSGPISVEIR